MSGVGPQIFRQKLFPGGRPRSVLVLVLPPFRDLVIPVAYAMEFNDDGRPYFVSVGADQVEGGDGYNQDLASNDGFDD